MNIGGIYTDPYHSPTSGSSNIFGFNVPWFGGIRIIGNHNISNDDDSDDGNNDDDDDDDSNKFITIGCDDGFHWWVLTGKFTNKSKGHIDMDFTPKAPGVGMLKCSYKPGALSFLKKEDTDNIIGLQSTAVVDNIWSRLIAPPEYLRCGIHEHFKAEIKHAAFNNVNGLFFDSTIYNIAHANNSESKSSSSLSSSSLSFAGMRVISDRLGKIIRDEICVVGTDDGINWWYITGGNFTDKMNGKFSLNNDNNSSLSLGSGSGTCHNGIIEFDNGTIWQKVALNKTDIHSWQKETTTSTTSRI